MFHQRIKPKIHLGESAIMQLDARLKWEEQNPGERKRREFYESGRLSDYLLNGGPLPGPGQHIGRGGK